MRYDPARDLWSPPCVQALASMLEGCPSRWWLSGGWAIDHWTGAVARSTLAAVRHRTKVTRGPGSRAAGLAMAFKLIEPAQARWRCVNAPHLVAVVRAGGVFQGGVVAERPGQAAA